MGTCYEENYKNILKLTLLSVTGCCLWQTNPNFSVLNRFPFPAAHQPAAQLDGPAASSGDGLPCLRVFTRPRPAGSARWALGGSLPCMAVALLWVWKGHVSHHPAGNAHLQSHGSGVPRVPGGARPQVKHISRLSCVTSAIVLWAKTSHLPSSGSAYRRWWPQDLDTRAMQEWTPHYSSPPGQQSDVCNSLQQFWIK